ncbi:hypothetical protein CNEO2_250018 [Clostridium neonatale]|nr:hypothetical protein CNEO2_60133 [Clostridium neonatale]CAI3215207.1 hypothetical protein CNEO2_80133 [Clostridium neonatale]CAI3234823.1 hypothetical protein CNEO2_250018 [Clostridium neonatale]CAI3246243.1 hypothetical protein CNEO2_520019 [Clostridium neonatale]CAI3554213.1 hypothetical protein CNEO4_270018 [Clostridium neonatale]
MLYITKKIIIFTIYIITLVNKLVDEYIKISISKLSINTKILIIKTQ